MTYIDISTHMLGQVPVEVVSSQFLPLLLGLAQDPVANVRVALSRSLADPFSRSLMLPPSAMLGMLATLC